MTLNTTIAIHEPMPVEDVYAFCRTLLGTPDDIKPTRHDSDYRRCKSIGHPMGVGLPALLDIYYGADGPLGAWRGDEDETDPESLAYFAEDFERNGWSSIVVTFDTGYAYREPNGAGCSDLHAWLVTQLGRWLDERGKTWKWENEFTGEWHDRFEGLDDFGNVEVGAIGSTVQRTRPEDGHEAFVRRLFGTPA